MRTRHLPDGCVAFCRISMPASVLMLHSPRGLFFRRGMMNILYDGLFKKNKLHPIDSHGFFIIFAIYLTII